MKNTSDRQKEKIEKFINQRQRHSNPLLALNYSFNPVCLKSAQGVFMIQQQTQKKLLDCINNVSHIGHANQYFVRKLQNSIKTLNTNSRFLYDTYFQTTRKLLEKFPKELCVVSYVNSGSEANDLAITMAKIYSKKKGIICLQGGYHGITDQTMKVASYKWHDNKNYNRPDDVYYASIPCTYRGKYRLFENSSQLYAEQLEKELQQNSKSYGVFISEMMQSCAGQVIPKKDYFNQIYKVLKKYQIVIIDDQVQTGFGRIGSNFWAFQYYNVVPDIVTIGKAMGNGFPVAAVVYNRKIADAFKDFGINFFSTFGGNPPAMAAVGAVLDQIKEKKLQQNAYVVGKYMKEKLFQLLVFKFVGDIRGQGLFQGIEIVSDKSSKIPDSQLALKILKKAREKGVLLSRDGLNNNIIKIKPPMIFSIQNVNMMMMCLFQIMYNQMMQRQGKIAEQAKL